MLKDTLLKLLTIPGPSGFEGACADYIESEMRPCADEIRRDVMGNLVCVKKGAPGGKRILLTAHMDEIGFIVTAIDDGTLPGAWGSTNIDDEGHPTQRTVLIENGVLKTRGAEGVGEIGDQLQALGIDVCVHMIILLFVL